MISMKEITATVIFLAAILWLSANGSAAIHTDKPVLQQDPSQPEAPVTDGQPSVAASKKKGQFQNTKIVSQQQEPVMDNESIPQEEEEEAKEKAKKRSKDVKPAVQPVAQEESSTKKKQAPKKQTEELKQAQSKVSSETSGTNQEAGKEVKHEVKDSNLPSTPEELLLEVPKETKPEEVSNGVESESGAPENGDVELTEKKEEKPQEDDSGPILQDIGIKPSTIQPLQPSTETAPKDTVPQTPPPAAPVDQGVQPPRIVVEDAPAGPGGEEAKDDVSPPSRKEDMPSFDEWKEKMLAQQAEEEKIKQQDLQAQASQPGIAGQVKPKPNINRINFAAASCGSKVMSTNPEAQNPGFILTENRDQYMINPCKARKWFLIELCEPVQVHSIEIGNLELFSSVPESFLVQVSDRYPTKEWTAIGTFHARDERTIQTFPVQNELLFVKYMKIEMLSHFGSEHYCPITLIRVFGTTVEDDDADEAAEADATAAAEDDDLLTYPEGTEPTNLLASATDTVLSLVKRVLTPGEKEEEDHKLKDDVVSLKGQKGNASNLNATAEEEGEPQPCPPDASPSGPPREKPVPVPPDQPQPPDALTSPPAESDSQAADPDVVILIERPDISVWSLLAKCNFCPADVLRSCPREKNSLCGYYRAFLAPLSCVTEPQVLPTNSFDTGSSRSVVVDSGTKATTVGSSSKLDSVIIPEYTGGDSQTEELLTADHSTNRVKKSSTLSMKATDDAIDPTPTSSTEAQSEVWASDIPIVESKPLEPPAAHSTATELKVPQEVPAESVSVSQSSSVASAESVTSDSCDSQSQGSSSDCMGPDLVQIRPTQTEAVVATDVPANGEQESISEDDAVVTDTTEAVEDFVADNAQHDAQTGVANEGVGVIPDKKPPQLNLTNGLRDIYAEAPTALESDFELEGVAPPTGEELQYQRLNTGKKETTYMRLKNRIKALELHLNLSSRYLEELSQRYKREMDEMHISLNRTISKLTNTSRSAEEKDVRQQEELDTLRDTVKNLTDEMRSMQLSMDDVHKQLIERHLFLMLAEATVFIIIMAWCTAKHRHPAPPYTPFDHPHLATPRRQPTRTRNQPAADSKTFVKTHRRHKSIDSPSRVRTGSDPVTLVPRSRDDIDIGKSGSDTDVPVIEPNIPLFLSNDIYKNVPKKKKKKKVQRQLGSFVNGQGIKLARSMSTSSLSHSHSGPVPVRPSDSNSSQTSAPSASSSGSSLNGNSRPARNLSADFANPKKPARNRSHSPLFNRAKRTETLGAATSGRKGSMGTTFSHQNGGLPNGGLHSVHNGHCSQTKRSWFGPGKVTA